MKIEISIDRKGKERGTLGWLAANAATIHIGETKRGNLAAWLQNHAGENLMVLAIQDAYGVGEGEIAQEITLPSGDVQCPVGPIYAVSPACFRAIRRLAEIARDHMEDPDEETEADISTSITRSPDVIA